MDEQKTLEYVANTYESMLKAVDEFADRMAAVMAFKAAATMTGRKYSKDFFIAYVDRKNEAFTESITNKIKDICNSVKDYITEG